MATEETPTAAPESLGTSAVEPAAPARADTATGPNAQKARGHAATPKAATKPAKKTATSVPVARSANPATTPKGGGESKPKPKAPTAKTPTPKALPKTSKPATPKNSFTLAGVDHTSKAAFAKSVGVEPRLIRRALRKGGSVDGALTKLQAKRDTLAAQLAELDALLAALSKAS